MEAALQHVVAKVASIKSSLVDFERIHAEYRAGCDRVLRAETVEEESDALKGVCDLATTSRVAMMSFNSNLDELGEWAEEADLGMHVRNGMETKIMEVLQVRCRVMSDFTTRLAAKKNFIVDNSSLCATTEGLHFRRSTDQDDKASFKEHNIAPWGSRVRGIPSSDEWLQVGDRFLPFNLGGSPVLAPAADAQDDQLEGLEALCKAVIQLRDEFYSISLLIDAQGKIIDDIVTNVATARENTKCVVVELIECPRARTQTGYQCAIAVGAAVSLGSAAMAPGHVVVVTVVLLRGALAAVSTQVAAHHLAKWEQRKLELILEDLNKINVQHPQVQLASRRAFVRAGARSEETALELLRLRWRTLRTPENAMRLVRDGLETRGAPSSIRKGGLAFMFSFESRLPAAAAFEKLRDLQAIGSLDPQSRAWWSFPICEGDCEDVGSCEACKISVRYSLYHKWFGKVARDFITISRSTRVAGEADQFLFATSSLDCQALATLGMPVHDDPDMRGFTACCAVFIVKAPVGCRVQVVGDVDPKLSAPVIIVDRCVKQSTRDTALLLKRNLTPVIEQDSISF